VDLHRDDVVLPLGSYGHRLICPVCNGENLHQQAVGVYHHTLDDNRGVLITPDGECIAHTNVHANILNPSGDREGMRVNFWCESDCKVPDLLLYQHEGTTFIEWDFESQERSLLWDNE